MGCWQLCVSSGAKHSLPSIFEVVSLGGSARLPMERVQHHIFRFFVDQMKSVCERAGSANDGVWCRLSFSQRALPIPQGWPGTPGHLAQTPCEILQFLHCGLCFICCCVCEGNFQWRDAFSSFIFLSCPFRGFRKFADGQIVAAHFPMFRWPNDISLRSHGFSTRLFSMLIFFFQARVSDCIVVTRGALPFGSTFASVCLICSAILVCELSACSRRRFERNDWTWVVDCCFAIAATHFSPSNFQVAPSGGFR